MLSVACNAWGTGTPLHQLLASCAAADAPLTTPDFSTGSVLCGFLGVSYAMSLETVRVCATDSVGLLLHSQSSITAKALLHKSARAEHAFLLSQAHHVWKLLISLLRERAEARAEAYPKHTPHRKPPLNALGSLLETKLHVLLSSYLDSALGAACQARSSA